MKNLLIALSLLSFVGCQAPCVEAERQNETAYFHWKVQSKTPFEYAKLTDRDLKEFVTVAPNAKKEGEYFVAGPFDTAIGPLKDVNWVCCTVVFKSENARIETVSFPREEIIDHVFTSLAPGARPVNSKPFVFKFK